MSSKVLMAAKGLEIRFGGVVAADDVNIEIHEGHNLAIIGPNGAGKTTFLNICTGYLKPHRGSVTFDGRDVTGLAPRRLVRMGVARAFQIPQLFTEHTVIENLLIAAAAQARRWSPLTPIATIPERGEMLHLLDMVRCAHIADRPVSELPEGQRKLIDIALALALKPKLLFMDEPTSGVASSEKFEVLDIIAKALAEAKVTAVFVEHDIGIVERFADEVAVWNRGEVLFRGVPGEILSHPDVIRDVIGETV
ncbi:ABC transporter ATP-binding protein [Acuticoccus mangrovi]|uniref:ATP-binding cassette domain-containing protein n=1 Tax=Acuticoccus mangrovi TaxID=2796142 RepID=A0A934MNA2_9HYPH|nr:ATP-binding cassette domain-containing protein [Acuticoccus mangrovi]MBJ3778004.1 ATP-binding cassette domain-containing protein [Acuticoccus mangrovi]